MGAREELAAVLAKALYATDVNLAMSDPLDISCRDIGDALAPMVARLLDEARREAWDEGWEAGRWGATRTLNPYRAEGAP